MGQEIGRSGEEGGSLSGDGDDSGTQSAEAVTADNYIPADGESASETAKNIAALLSDEDGSRGEGEREEEETEGEEKSTTGNPAQQIETAQQKADRVRDEQGKFVKTPKQGKVVDPDLQPHSNLPAALHKDFNNLPEGLKRHANKIFKTAQADYTRNMQAVSEIRQKAEPIISTAQNYIRSNNLQDDKGVTYTEQRLFNELLDAHHNIVLDKDRTIAGMIQRTGASPENISAYLRGENPSGVDIQRIPEIRSLQSTVSTLQQRLDARDQAETQARIAPRTQAFFDVISEKDPATGEHLRPELLDEAFIADAKPAVDRLLRVDPDLSPGEALKRVYATMIGREYSTNTTPRPVPTRQPNQFQQRAKAAAVSVRGRIAPLGTGDNSAELSLEEIPQSATETTRLIWNRLNGG